MRFVSFEMGGAAHYGVLDGDGIADLSAVPGAPPSLGAALRESGAGGLEKLAAQAGDAAIALDSVTLLPPVTDPGKIICVGLNYRPHVEETGRDLPDYPTLFTRYPDSLVAHGRAMEVPTLSHRLDFEGELAVIIGETAHNVPEDRAFDHVGFYACFNDGSVRDFQRHTSQFFAGKNFLRSGAFGPWIVARDAVPDITDAAIETRLNGEVMQSATIADLIFSIPQLIAYISAIIPLHPGDIIATGTPGGVGMARDPKVWLKAGDRVEVTIAGVGTLSNPVA